MKKRAPKGCSLEQQFWLGVARKDDPTTCWEWIGARNSRGYGHMRVAKKYKAAHRASYEVNIGPIPSGMHVMHTCDNPPCCNPSHLTLGAHEDNMRDCAEKGRAKRASKGGKGIKNAGAKLKDSEVRYMRALHATGCFTQRELAERFGVHVMTVNMIVRGLRWRHLLEMR